MKIFRRHLRAFPAAVAATAAAIGLVGATSLPRRAPAPAPAPAEQPVGDPLTDLVNPFTGTLGQGNTFPGATVPFGMVQLSPDTGAPTGYSYDATRIRGFSLTHLSGVGCAAGGDLSILATTGPPTATDEAEYAVGFSHRDEEASPGYYRVGLANGVSAELTATTRTGWQRYTFPATAAAAHGPDTEGTVLLNSGQALHRVVSSTITVLDDRTVAATITGRGFCQDTLPYTVYTVTRFSHPFRSYGTWGDGAVTDGSGYSSGPGRRGAYLRFDTARDRTVTATTALSYVSVAGARRNLEAEGGGTFDSVRWAAQRAWERRLAVIRVRGGSPARRRSFYTALYHALLHPNTGTDVDGSYTGYDGRVHRATGFTYYQNWSLWDTYRTQAQLLSLIAPAQARDMALSVLRVNRDGGWLPKWGLGTVETNTMSGDPVTPYLVNAFHQGLLRGHEQEAYAALRRNADSVPPASSPFEGRGANPSYLLDGFVPLIPHAPHKPGDSDLAHGASATLEYALADAALGAMAERLGHAGDAARYLARGANYRHIFDPLTGWFRARDANGYFTGPADPLDSVGFHEGGAWQYQWLVPQDLPGLVRMLGGRRGVNQRLDWFFHYPELPRHPAATARTMWNTAPSVYYHSDVYNPDNEPDIGAPYVYLATGEPWKTADVVRAALTLFPATPGGGTGNDDLGTMSSWAVLSSLGLYPVMPGTAVWGLSTPAFPRIDLSLDPAYFPAGHLTILAPGVSGSARYVRAVWVGGVEHPATWLTTDDLRTAGEIRFVVGRTPSVWGTHPGDGPPSLLS